MRIPISLSLIKYLSIIRWRKILFSHETKMELFGLNAKVCVAETHHWPSPWEHHPAGNMVVASCCEDASLQQLQETSQGKNDGAKHKAILEENMMPSKKDNDRKHGARATMERLRSKHVHVLKCSTPQSNSESMARLENSCSDALHPIRLSFSFFAKNGGTFLLMCKAGGDKPQKTWGCNRSRRGFKCWLRGLNTYASNGCQLLCSHYLYHNNMYFAPSKYNAGCTYNITF